MSRQSISMLTTSVRGLELLLPAGEVEIMRILWAHGPLLVRDVHEHILSQRQIAYTTVLTVCSRLFKKGLLQRELADDGASYLYEPTTNEATFVAQTLAAVLDSIISEYPTALNAYLARPGNAGLG